MSIDNLRVVRIQAGHVSQRGHMLLTLLAETRIAASEAGGGDGVNLMLLKGSGFSPDEIEPLEILKLADTRIRDQTYAITLLGLQVWHLLEAIGSAENLIAIAGGLNNQHLAALHALAKEPGDPAGATVNADRLIALGINSDIVFELLAMGLITRLESVYGITTLGLSVFEFCADASGYPFKLAPKLTGENASYKQHSGNNRALFNLRKIFNIKNYRLAADEMNSGLAVNVVVKNALNRAFIRKELQPHMIDVIIHSDNARLILYGVA